jgi:hypothetical protein
MWFRVAGWGLPRLAVWTIAAGSQAVERPAMVCAAEGSSCEPPWQEPRKPVSVLSGEGLDLDLQLQTRASETPARLLARIVIGLGVLAALRRDSLRRVDGD